MVLNANDELRHPVEGDFADWRESMYWNFAMPELGLGGWIYAWVLPNQETDRTGMLVSFYKGLIADVSVPHGASERPDHLVRLGDGRWMYHYAKNLPETSADDFDDFSVAGLSLKREEPLKRYRLQFDDGLETAFDISCEYLTPPWDWRDNVHPTPWYIAQNRYFRAWRGEGWLRAAGEEHQISVTGDSDHSWGRRNPDTRRLGNLKIFSVQVPDVVAASVSIEGEPLKELPRGFIQHGQDIFAVTDYRESATYDDDGLPRRVEVEFDDTSGRTTKLDGEMFAAHPLGRLGDTTWRGCEGPATYRVNDKWEGTGIVTNVWAPGVKPGNYTPETTRGR